MGIIFIGKDFLGHPRTFSPSLRPGLSRDKNGQLTLTAEAIEAAIKSGNAAKLATDFVNQALVDAGVYNTIEEAENPIHKGSDEYIKRLEEQIEKELAEHEEHLKTTDKEFWPEYGTPGNLPHGITGKRKRLSEAKRLRDERPDLIGADPIDIEAFLNPDSNATATPTGDANATRAAPP